MPAPADARNPYVTVMPAEPSWRDLEPELHEQILRHAHPAPQRQRHGLAPV